MRNAAVLLFLALPARAQPQPSPASLKFEVVILKPTAPGATQSATRFAPGGERYEAFNTTLKNLMTAAYRIRPDLMTGGPAWIESEHFDMNAKAERPSSVDDLHTMLKNVLLDEFKLKLHRETKELPVYALIQDKDGAKLSPLEGKSDVETPGETEITFTRDKGAGEAPKRTMHARVTPMGYLAYYLSLMLDRPVINLTGLKGSFDLEVSYTPEPPRAVAAGTGEASVDTSGPTIFEAIRKLGLKLERQKGPVEIIVIDHAEKPAGN